MRVIITNELNEMWATPEQFATMSDAEIIGLCWEDIESLLQGATWDVQREENERAI